MLVSQVGEFTLIVLPFSTNHCIMYCSGLFISMLVFLWVGSAGLQVLEKTMIFFRTVFITILQSKTKGGHKKPAV